MFTSLVIDVRIGFYCENVCISVTLWGLDFEVEREKLNMWRQYLLL